MQYANYVLVDLLSEVAELLEKQQGNPLPLGTISVRSIGETLKVLSIIQSAQSGDVCWGRGLYSIPRNLNKEVQRDELFPTSCRTV